MLDLILSGTYIEKEVPYPRYRGKVFSDSLWFHAAQLTIYFLCLEALLVWVVFPPQYSIGNIEGPCLVIVYESWRDFNTIHEMEW